MPSSITFQQEEKLNLSFKNKEAIRKWIKRVIISEGRKCGELLYFFCTDRHLLEINKKFLNHTTYTDIITFDYSTAQTISGEIYISVERVKENAATYEQAFNDELKRVIIHGVLHLCGYSDKTDAQKKVMRKKENHALDMF